MVNAVVQEVTGYDESEVAGQNILDFFVPPAWRSIVLERFSRTWSESLRKPHQNPWLSKSGREIMIEWRCIGVHPPWESVNSRPWIYGIGVVVKEHVIESPDRTALV
jgi:PAS domain-containing protein